MLSTIALLVIASSADAALMHGVAKGTITGGYDYGSGAYSAAFGVVPGNIDHTGQNLTADVWYDTAMAPSGAWMKAEVTVNGITRAIDNNLISYLTISDSNEGPPGYAEAFDYFMLSYHSLYLAPSDLQVNWTRLSFSFAEYLDDALFSGHDLSQAFDWVDNDSSDGGSGVVTLSEYVSENFDERFPKYHYDTKLTFKLDSISVAHVPEPSTLALLGLGSALAIGRRRKGRSTP